LQRDHLQRTGRNLLQELVQAEVEDGRRLLYVDPQAVAFVPAFARYPYEVWVAPRRAVPALADFTAAKLHSLARALKTVLVTYDAFWNGPFP
jgi:UDPglucose--hexose-1-phosphate uridylyltransferase